MDDVDANMDENMDIAVWIHINMWMDQVDANVIE